MINELAGLKQLIACLSQVPYLASKNMYRVVDYFLRMDDSQLQQFCQALISAKNSIMYCVQCFAWQEKGRLCIFCQADKRDQATVCVVENWQELLSVEKTGGYAGLYHVLGGVLNPLEGKGPEHLTIDVLCKRVATGSIKEVILATNQTPEGEATAMYIAKKLQGTGALVSCLARGLPVGSTLEYMDRLTVFKALSERRPF
jgi:recombination protein RecR